MKRSALSPTIASGVLFIAAIIAFYPSLAGDFIWDDHAYLLSQPEARQISWASIRWAFSLDAAVAGHYHPLTWLSWMLDFTLAGGPDPRVFHATNLLLHGASVVLVFCLFRSLLQGAGHSTPDWLIVLALLPYAVHPLRVESVAWITERRDLLCGVLYAATLLVYVRTAGGTDRGRRIALTMLPFVACGLSKAWVISLLPMMWIIDRYLLGHLGGITVWRDHRDWLLARWPLLVGTLLFLALGLIAAQRSGAMVGLDDHGVGARLQQAAFAWWYYPSKTLWPAPVAPYYGWAGFETGSALALSAVGGFVLLASMVVLGGRLRRWLLPTLLAYSVIILPVLGLVQSGPQLVADRYSYLAILPFHLALAAGLGFFWRIGRRIAVYAASVMLLVAGALLGTQAYALNAVFENEMAFWSRVIEVSPDDVTARHNRAKLAWREGNAALAVSDLRAADQSQTDAVASMMTLADIHLALGQFSDAELLVSEAARRGFPAQSHVISARIARARKDSRKEIAAWREAVRLAPGDTSYLLELAGALGSVGESSEALDVLEGGIGRWSDNPDLRAERAVHLAAVGRLEEAVFELDSALAMAPRSWAHRPRAEASREQLVAALGLMRQAK